MLFIRQHDKMNPDNWKKTQKVMNVIVNLWQVQSCLGSQISNFDCSYQNSGNDHSWDAEDVAGFSKCFTQLWTATSIESIQKCCANVNAIGATWFRHNWKIAPVGWSVQSTAFQLKHKWKIDDKIPYIVDEKCNENWFQTYSLLKTVPYFWMVVTVFPQVM